MLETAVPIAEIWRGPLAESHHSGHAVIADATGAVHTAWGDPETHVLPRSSAKMIQALPLVASGAADAAGLAPRHLALACASHEAEPVHIAAVEGWLADLDLGEADLRCGAQATRDRQLKLDNIRAGHPPRQTHNECSGKHVGFLTLNRRIAGGPEYQRPDHPVQRAVREAFETVTDRTSPGFGIDGCSAPNFVTTLGAMARAMAVFASATETGDALSRAAARLTGAMMAHPEMVAGNGRATTRLMQAAREPVALKSGAEGFFVAILPARGLGIALKCVDGADRAAECAIATILVRLGVLDPAHPDVAQSMTPQIRNRAGTVTGEIRPGAALLA